MKSIIVIFLFLTSLFSSSVTLDENSNFESSWVNSVGINSILENDFSLCTKFSTSGAKMFGVSTSDTDYSYKTIDYTIYSLNSNIYMYNNGSYIANYGTHNNDDIFCITRVGSDLNFTKNGTAFNSISYTSSSLVFDSSIFGHSNYIPSSFIDTTLNNNDVQFSLLSGGITINNSEIVTPNPDTTYELDLNNNDINFLYGLSGLIVAFIFLLGLHI